MPDNPEDIRHSVEIDKLISKANFHRMRGEYIEAEDAFREVLSKDESRTDMREMVADMLYARGQLQEAKSEYKKIMESCPGNTSAETKYAKVVLEIGEHDYEKLIAKEMLENPQKFAEAPKHPLLSFILSALVPGLGQIYNKELVKGAIILGLFLFSLLIFALSPVETANLFNTFKVLIGAASKAPQLSPFIALFAIMFVFLYIYAVIDAPIASSKSSHPERKKMVP